MPHRLRLFTGEEETLKFPVRHVRVRLGDITEILTEASRRNRSWLSDFENDEIEVSPDLYEVLSAYMEMRTGA